jgi:ATP synthase protein I
LITQTVLLILAAIILFWWQGESMAKAAAFGCAIPIGNGLLQRWHLSRAAKTARADAGMNLRKAYRCVVERWVWTFLMFTVGFALLQLAPLPLLAGFIATQSVLFLKT